MKAIYFEQNPVIGVGVGLRQEHFSYILDQKPSVSWFEALTENFLVAGGPALFYLEKIRQDYAVTLHGIGLSIGSVSAIDWEYLSKVKQLATRIQSFWISDHLCWNQFNGRYANDLLPLPLTEEALNHVVSRIHAIQDFLQQKIMLENISSYLQFNVSNIPEWEFLNTICEKTGCYLLLDINNIYVTCQNLELNPQHYIQEINKKFVKQFHLAGFHKQQDHLLDMHSEHVHPEVWQLFDFAIKQLGSVATAIEWDINIPSFEVLMSEVTRAESVFS